MPFHWRSQHPWKNIQVSQEESWSMVWYLFTLICLSAVFNNYYANRGVVLSTKMNRTIVIRRDFLHYIKKYNRFEKRHKTVSCHCSPAFRLKQGDVVTVGQCRPISKTVRFNVIRKEVQRVEGNVKKAFVLFWATSFLMAWVDPFFFQYCRNGGTVRNWLRMLMITLLGCLT